MLVVAVEERDRGIVDVKNDFCWDIG